MYYCLVSLLSPSTSEWEMRKALEREAHCVPALFLTVFLVASASGYSLERGYGHTDPWAAVLQPSHAPVFILYFMAFIFGGTQPAKPVDDSSFSW